MVSFVLARVRLFVEQVAALLPFGGSVYMPASGSKEPLSFVGAASMVCGSS